MTNSNTTPYEQAAEYWMNLITTFESDLDEIDRLATEIADLERLQYWERSKDVDRLAHQLYLLRQYGVMETLVRFIAEWRKPNCIVCWEASLPASVQVLTEYRQELHEHLPFIAAILRAALAEHDETFQWTSGWAQSLTVRFRYGAKTQDDLLVFLNTSSGFEAWSRIHP